MHFAAYAYIGEPVADPEKYYMDIRYINEASVWTDLKIILKTFPALFTTIWKNY